MKIPKYELAQEGYASLNLHEQLKWAFFFFCVDLIGPILLDPLGLDCIYLGLEVEQFIEFFMYMIVPFLVMYFINEISVFSSFGGFFWYFFITGIFNMKFPADESIFFYFTDLYAMTIFIVCLMDIGILGESETNNEEDLLI